MWVVSRPSVSSPRCRSFSAGYPSSGLEQRSAAEIRSGRTRDAHSKVTRPAMKLCFIERSRPYAVSVGRQKLDSLR
jgi:hypothetical protein